MTQHIPEGWTLITRNGTEMLSREYHFDNFGVAPNGVCGQSGERLRCRRSPSRDHGLLGGE